MGTLRKLKMKMKFDRDWHKTLVRGARNEILIDIDGDKEPDVAIMDTTGNGDIDTLAVDLTGDGEFNLYISDTDGNGIPDLILMDEDGKGDLKVLGMGKEVEEAIITAASAVKTAIATGDYISQLLDAALDDLDKQVKIARKQLKKLR
jgi:hypothetical protein